MDRAFFLKLTKQNCYLCGVEPKQEHKHDKRVKIPYIYNGIDRVDNTKGYVEGNIEPCCKLCNRIKLVHDLDFLFKHIKTMLEYRDNA